MMLIRSHLILKRPTMQNATSTLSQFLDQCARRGCGQATLNAYRADLQQFFEFLQSGDGRIVTARSPLDTTPSAPLEMSRFDQPGGGTTGSTGHRIISPTELDAYWNKIIAEKRPRSVARAWKAILLWCKEYAPHCSAAGKAHAITSLELPFIMTNDEIRELFAQARKDQDRGEISEELTRSLTLLFCDGLSMKKVVELTGISKKSLVAYVRRHIQQQRTAPVRPKSELSEFAYSDACLAGTSLEERICQDEYLRRHPRSDMVY